LNNVSFFAILDWQGKPDRSLLDPKKDRTGTPIVTDNADARLSGLDKLMPETMQGWKAMKPDHEYTFDTLFDLIDGGAEAYRSLNVRKVLDRRYAKEGAANIFVDIFDMGSSRDAFGAFHHDIREDADAGIGMESEYQGSSLFFWKDRYFVSVVALEDTAETRKVVLALGQAISARIPRLGTKPDIVKLLPTDGLQKEQIYYFHDLETLERRYSIGKGNPLHLSKETEGLLARYRVPHIPTTKQGQLFAVFLIVSYASKSTVLAAEQDFSAVYLDRIESGTLVQLPSKGWAGICRKDSHLFVVLESPDRATARRLLDSVNSEETK
jgi:hypothetical protein